jgi:hypothetical protein
MNPLITRPNRSHSMLEIVLCIAIALWLGCMACLLTGCAPPQVHSAETPPLSEVLYQQIQNEPPSSVCPDCPSDCEQLTERLDQLDARVKALESPTKITAKTESGTFVEFYTRSPCPPCDAWKAQQQPRFESAGITVKTIEASSGSTPRFRILVGNRFITHDGSLTFELYQQLVSRRATP